jgi:hypothetical protein
MAENYNIDPYYDDFDPNKNFHRILFKPGYAVQARELTQSQTILQNQISQFASAIYSQNTPVSGGQVTTNLNCYYLKLNPTYNNLSISASSFIGQKITNDTGSIIAQVVSAAEATGNALVAGDPPTLIVTYLSGGRFVDTQTLYITDGVVNTPVATLIGVTTGQTTCTGLSSVASVSSGVFWVINGYNTVTNADGTTSQYQIGNFVNLLPQTVILDKYDNIPSLRVGLNIVESTVTYVDDASLLDPAPGATNYLAPGADRYQVTLNLETRPLTIGNDDNFIELLRINNGQIVKQSTTTTYSALDDYIAKRDYETNGDYVVEDFKLTPTPNAAGNSAYYDMIISKGVAYVHGYRVENQSNITLTSPRAQNTAVVQPGNNNVFVSYGSYYTVDTSNGTFDITTMPTIDLHCVSQANIVSTNTTTYSSTLIGTGYIRGLQYLYTTGTNNYVYQAYVNDITTTSLSSNVNTALTTSNTIQFFDITGKLSSIANAYYGATLAITGGTDTGDVRIINSWNPTTKTATVNQPFTVTPDGTSNVSIIFSTGNAGSIVQKNPTLFGLTAGVNINVLSGRVNGVNAGAAILWNASTPEMIFQLPNSYIANGSMNSVSFTSTMIWRNVTWSGVTNATTPITTPSGVSFQGTGSSIFGETFRQNYTVIDTVTGKILDFNTSANCASVNTSTSAIFQSAAYTAANRPVNIIADVVVSVPALDYSGIIVKTKTLITGNTGYVGTFSTAVPGANTNTFLDLNTGQAYILGNTASNTAGAISLYVADVKNITKIYDTGARGTSLTTGTSLTNYRDITTSFSFDNGQRDNFYDFASIKLLPGVAPPKGNILVVFNYYAPSGGDAFFNGTSYLPNGTTEKYAQIPSYTSKRGTLYNLRDCIDFRPVRQNNTNANTYTWVYKTAPASTAGNSGGMFLPVNNGNFTSGYQYYLARKDKLVLTKDSNFLMILGTPSVNAISPTEPDGSLVLANISLDPYTAYVPGEGPNYSTGESSYGTTTRTVPVNLSVNKVIHKRWAKSDISDLQTQVDNLEYYTSLSLLESNANALQVPDVNGLNRFKNGILVDDFSTYATSDTTSFNNYKANINIRTKTMSPLTHINNFQLQNPLVLGTLGTLPKTTSYAISTLNGTQTNIYTLPYTTANLITQPLASNTVSVNPFNVVLYEGICTLNPPMDNWVNNIEAPNVIITEPQFQFTQQTGGINLTNAGDYQSLPGTTVAPATGSATTTNQAYASQASGLNQATGTSSAAATPLSATNGYVTNNGVLPYIRPQEVIIRAKGLLVNAPLACWFDGINVDKYMIQPNTIELYNVKGRFEEDDIVGFYDNVTTRQFFPIGRVVSTYNYGANTATSKNGLSNTRLYISSYIQTPNTVATVNLINAYFSSNGQYQYSTANGQVKFTNANSIITLHTNGNVAAAGNGKFTSTTQNVVAGLYKTIFISGASTFFNQYAAWGDQNNGTTWNAYFPVSVVANANYTITTSSTSAGSTNFGYTYNGLYYYTAVVTGGYNTGNPVSTTITTIPGATSIGAFGALRWDAANTANAFLSWNQTNPSNTTAGIAVTVRDSNNNLIWNTMSPNGLTMANVATKFTMVGGGSMFTGCKQIVLDKNASSANQFYQGSAITVKTTLIYPHNYTAEYIPPTPQLYVVVGSVSNGDGDTSWPVYDWVDDTAGIKARAEKIANEQAQVVWLSSTYTFSANVIDYYGPTRVATLDAPVDIAIGTNQQYGQITSQYSLNGVVASVKDAMYYGNTIPKLSSDERGNFAAVFNIPGSQFYTGQRVFRVDNRNRASNDPKSATTYAESTFWAGGVQDSTNSFSPSVDSSARNFTPQNSQGYNIVSQTSPIDPVAQTFLVDKQNYPNGVFLSSLKLFFAPYQNSLKAPTAPVIVSLMGTLNGYPNGKTLDHSIVVKSGEDIKVSNAPHYLDPDTYTEFVFDAPVYVQSGVLYAFVVHSNSVDYSLYYGGQNQIAITSTSTALPIGKGGVAPTKPSKIGAAPYVGALFESQNSITWTADQTKDLMFVMNQCKFDITQNPTIPFSTTYQLRSRKLGRQDVLQKVDANLVSSVYMSQGTDQSMHAFNVSTTDFVPSSTGLTYSYSSTLQVGQSVTTPQSITPGRFGTPAQDNFYLNDGKGARTLLTGSNTSFQLFAQLSSSDANVSPILSDDGIALYSILYSVDNLGIPTKAVSVANTGAGYSNNATIVITSALGKSNSLNDYLTNDLPVFGYTTNSFTGAISSIYTTYQGSGYVATPTITILDPTTRSGNALINASPFSTSVNGIGTTNFLGQLQVGATLTTQNNIVIGTIQSITNSNNLILTTNALSWSNANTYFCSNATFVVSGETSPTGGNAQHRYYTKKVILTPGNDSGDLRVYCTAYKPAGSQIYVYYRILNAADTGKLEDQNWQIMTQKGGAGVFSTARSNLIEYEYAPGNFYGTSPNNSISYTSTTTGSTYNKFIQFAIKVIIVTSDKTAVPFLSDIRALALPSGTGT